jgi:hypothetical protein
VGDFLNSSDTKITERWWFWLIIGLISAFMIVLLGFGIRGYVRYKRIKRRHAEFADRDVSVTVVNGGGTPPTKPEGDIELGVLQGTISMTHPHVEVQHLGNEIHKLERAGSATW